MGDFSDAARLIGSARRRDILNGPPESADGRAVALDALETMGLIQEERDGRLQWTSPGPPAIQARLAALRDGAAAALLSLPSDPLCPVSVCATPNGAVAGQPRLRNWGGAAGSGLIVRDAALSCLFEVAERCSQMRSGDEPTIVASYEELADRAIDPARLLQFSERQAMDPVLDTTLDGGTRIEWTPAHDPFRGDTKWIATEFCYRSAERSTGAWTCPSDSNGCATGWTAEQAFAKGFLEVVERDAVAIWWFNRLRRPPFPKDIFAHPAIGAVANWQANHHRRLHLIDLTSDLGIPVAAAVSCGEDGRGIAVGFGAHLDPVGAAVRAILEMVHFQLMIALSLGLRAQGRLRATVAETEAAWVWFEDATIADEPYLVPEAAAPLAARHVRSGELSELEVLQAVAERHRLETLSVDMTREAIGVPAARVIVPGLCSAKRRFGARRLYEVPVALGWRSSAIAEEDLNPRALVF